MVGKRGLRQDAQNCTCTLRACVKELAQIHGHDTHIAAVDKLPLSALAPLYMRGAASGKWAPGYYTVVCIWTSLTQRHIHIKPRAVALPVEEGPDSS